MANEIYDTDGKQVPSPTLYALLATWHKQRSNKGYWTEHTDWPLADWQAEVANDDTRESYDEWIINQIEQKYYGRENI